MYGRVRLSIERTTMMRLPAILFTLCSLASVPALAVDTDAVLGGAVGGGIGAAVGSEVGGREGAIVGGAVGAAVGTAIATKDREHNEQNTGKTVVYREEPGRNGPPGHAYGHRVPPGHAKHKHKHKHRHH
jgi:hypothetical protein